MNSSKNKLLTDEQIEQVIGDIDYIPQVTVGNLNGGGSQGNGPTSNNANPVFNTVTTNALIDHGPATVGNLTVNGNESVSGNLTVSGTINGSVTNFSGPLNGDVTGLQSATFVSKLQGTPVSAAAPGPNKVLQTNNAGNQWVPTTATNQATPSTIAQRDAQATLDAARFTASGPGNSNARMTGGGYQLTGGIASGLTVNYSTGTSQSVASPGFVAGVNLVSDATVTVTSIPTGVIVGSIILVSGASNEINNGLFQVSAISGLVISVAGQLTPVPTDFYFLQQNFYTSSAGLATVALANVTLLQPSDANGTWEYAVGNNAITNVGATQLSLNPFITNVSGSSPISVTAPDSTGSVTVSIGTSGVTAGTYPNPNNGNYYPVFTVNSSGVITSATTAVITGAAPTGAAGGDLSGNYPNPTVVQINGSPLGTTTGATTGQVLEWNGSSWAPASLGGDVTGSFVANTVTAIQGTGVSTTAPTANKFLQYNSVSNKWEPVSVTGDATIGASGALTLATVNATTTSQGSASNTLVITANAKGLVTSITSTPIAISGSQITSGTISVTNGGTGQSSLTAYGVLIGEGTNGINSVVLTDGQLLIGQTNADPIATNLSGDATLSNLGALTLATVNSNVGTYGTASNVSQVTVNAKGLVTAVSNVPIAINGNQITSGVVSVSNGGTGRSSLTQYGVLIGEGTNGINSVNLTTGQILIGQASGDPAAYSITGDVTLSAVGLTTVTALQGNAVSSTAPTNGQVLEWNGTAWTPTTVVSGVSSVTGTSPVVITGTASAPNVTLQGTTNYVLVADGSGYYQSVQLSGDATIVSSGALTLATVNSNTGSFGTASNVSTFTVNAKGLITAASNTPIAISGSQITSGTVSVVNGGTGQTSLTANGVLIGEGTNGINSVVLGSGQILVGQTTGDPAATDLSGDATLSPLGALTLATVNSNVGTYGTASNVSQVTVNAKGLVTAVSNVPIAINGNQITSGVVSVSNGGTGQSSLTLHGVLIGEGTNGINSVTMSSGQILIGQASGDPAAYSITGDVTLSTGGLTTVTALQGNAVSLTAPTNGQVLEWNGTAWTPTSVVTGVSSITGTSPVVITGTASAPNVTLQGTTNYVLVADGTGFYQSVQLSGDATIVSSGALTLATVNSNTGSFGTASNVSTFTVNAKGLITAASNTPIAIDGSQITSGTVSVTNGGTGQTSLTQYGVLVGEGTSGVNGVVLASGQLLIGQTSADPAAKTVIGDATISASGTLSLSTVNATTGLFGSASNVAQVTVNAKGLVTLAANVPIAIDGSQITSGTVSVSNGGTGQTTLTQYGVLVGEGTSGVNGVVLGSGQLLIGQTSADPMAYSLTGDATLSSIGALTFNTVNSNVGAFGSASSVAQITVNGKGLVTAASSIPIAINGNQITGGTVSVTNGGTGQSSLTQYGVLIGEGTSGVNGVVLGSGQLLIGQTSADPMALTLSGDATLSSIGALTFNTVNSNVGAFGSASSVATFTVNAKGLVTAASSTPIAINGNQITGGTVSVSNGGTGQSSLTQYGVLIGEGTSGVNGIVLSSGQLLIGQTGADPAATTVVGDATLSASGTLTLATVNSTTGLFGSASNVAQVTVNAKGLVTLAANVPIAINGSQITSGTVSVVNGGTGQSSLTAHGILIGEGTSSVNSIVLADGQLLVGQTGADPAATTVSGDATLLASGALTLATSGVTAGTYNIANVNVDSKGRVTMASSASPSTTVTNDLVIWGNTTGSSIVDSSGINVPSTGTLNGVKQITAPAANNLTLTAPATYGIVATNDMTIQGNLAVSGTTTTVNMVNLNVGDNAIFLNDGYTLVGSSHNLTGGITVNNYATAASFGPGSATYVAGIMGTSNPTLTFASAPPFTTGTIIQITGAGNAANNGLYEVLSVVGNVLTITGVGLTAPSNDFFQKQFIAETDSTTIVTPISVGMIRCNNGVWEVANGSTTPLVFTSISTSTSTVTSVSGQAPIVSSGGTTPTISLQGTTNNVLVADGSGYYQSVPLSGDATIVSTGALTLATVNSNVGSFGTASSVSTVTVNAKGLITAASNTPIAISGSQITSGTVSVTNGGTGQTSLTQYGVLIGEGTSGVNGVVLASGQLLIGQTSADPMAYSLTGDATLSASGTLTLSTVNATTGLFGSASNVAQVTVNAKGLVTLAANVPIAIDGSQITSGTVSVTNGGTGQTSLTQYGVLVGEGTSGVNGVVLASGQLLIGQTSADPMAYSLSGDATLSASGILTLSTVNATIGTYGTASSVSQVTVNAKGLITLAANVPIAINGNQITSGIVAVANGGTGQSSLTANGVLIGEGTSGINSVTMSSGSILIGQSSGDPAAYAVSGDVSLTNLGVATVTAIQGKSVSTTAPTSGQVLEWTGSTWAPTTLSVTPSEIVLSYGQILIGSGSGLTAAAVASESNIAIGSTNTASTGTGVNLTIGQSNTGATSTSNWSLVVGNNSSGSDKSIVLGNYAQANNANSFVFADGSSTTTFTDVAPNTFNVKATNGSFFYTDSAATIGAKLLNGLSTWFAISDRNKKENILELSYDDVLAKVDQLPVYQFNFIGTDASVVSRGPMAQDFNAIFPSAKDPLMIDTGDQAGITLAAVKGLHAIIKSQDERIKKLEAQLAQVLALLQK